MSAPLVERTAPGLHQHVMPLLLRIAPPPATVLDLGAGTGAWAERLVEYGYLATAVERDRSSFAAAVVPVTEADLNTNFSRLLPGRFDVITAIEVIEHLENPRQFLRECAALLIDGGRVIVTTPNVESATGRLRFMFTGELRHFGRDTRFSDGTHITPIHTLMFERIAADAGLRVVHHETYNAQVTSRASSRVLAALVRPLMRNVHGGDNHIFVLEK
jgi:2-polyprenyl-3-methyl-5-hydroxy-6-metoxy-1,4-benzoquinol methylase